MVMGVFTSDIYCFNVVQHTSKLVQYIANDTKCRALKLIKDKALQHYLYQIDNLYQPNPDMRKKVLEKRKSRKNDMELTFEAQRKKPSLSSD